MQQVTEVASLISQLKVSSFCCYKTTRHCFILWCLFVASLSQVLHSFQWLKAYFVITDGCFQRTSPISRLLPFFYPRIDASLKLSVPVHALWSLFHSAPPCESSELFTFAFSSSLKLGLLPSHSRVLHVLMLSGLCHCQHASVLNIFLSVQIFLGPMQY